MDQNNGILIRYAKSFKLRKTIKDGILARLATRNNRQDLGVVSVLNYLAHVIQTRGNTYDNDAGNHGMLFEMIDGVSNNGFSAQLQKLLGHFCAAHTRANAAGKNDHKHIFSCAHNYLRVINLRVCLQSYGHRKTNRLNSYIVSIIFISLKTIKVHVKTAHESHAEHIKSLYKRHRQE